MSVMVESVLMPFFSFHPFSAPMAFVLQPWQLFVTILAALINHYQQQVNDFQRICPFSGKRYGMCVRLNCGRGWGQGGVPDRMTVT